MRLECDNRMTSQHHSVPGFKCPYSYIYSRNKVRVLGTGYETREASGIWPQLCYRYIGSKLSLVIHFTIEGP